MRLIAAVLGISGVCCLTFGLLARETASQHAKIQHVAVDGRRFVRRLSTVDGVDVDDEDLLINDEEGSVTEASVSATTTNIRQYNLADIDRTQKHMSANSLLIYDGELDVFKVYHMIDKSNPAASVEQSLSDSSNNNDQDPTYLLVDALKTKFAPRFQPGQPSFQLLFSTSAHPQTDCVAEDNAVDADCNTDTFAPILQFGSVPKEEHLLPTVHAMPFPSYTSCLIDWKFGRNVQSSSDCSPLYRMDLDNTGKSYSDTTQWHDLKPQIIWRGSDTEFLPEYKLNLYRGKDVPVEQAINDATTSSAKAEPNDEELAATLLDKYAILTPRLRALALSIFAKRGASTNGSMPWIDAKFNADDHLADSMRQWGDDFLSHQPISQHELAQYKYLLDLGGVGGTSQEETIAKLALPGLLFHHESLTKDWFHREEMQPWVHYVPVKMDLSDLREMFVWAETHQNEAEAIARAGTELALRLVSNEYSKTTYDRLFGDFMGQVVRAYQPGQYETVESIIAQYEADGFEMTEHASCDGGKCSFVDGESITYVNGVSSLRKR